MAFEGATLEEVALPLVLLVGVVVARAATTWGFEAVGTHAAGGVLSQLRLDLVTARLRGDPTALDGTESAEVATAAVAGVDALQGLFARTLPQLVLAAVVPVTVLVVVASLDLLSAGLMLLTLPLVPVFFWLIGRATGSRARERWQAMSLLATHFLDVVRGLPTLRAFNRGEAQVERIERASDDYRMATMGTLRLAFLSGTVLELAATLGVALVAVTIGVRLVEGGIAFEPALTVLVLAPELYLPLRNLAAGFHASADGAAVADRLLGLIEQPATAPAGRATPPALGSARIRFDGVSFAYPDRPAAALSEVDLEIAPGETLALIGSSGGGKSTLASLLLRFREPSDGRILVDDVDLATCEPAAWRSQIAWLPQNPDPLSRDRRRQHPARCSGRDRRRRAQVARLAAVDSVVSTLPDGYATSSARATGHCPPVSANASPSHERFFAMRHSSYSTSPPPTSTRRAPGSSPKRSKAPPRTHNGADRPRSGARRTRGPDRHDRAGRIVESAGMSRTLRSAAGAGRDATTRLALSIALAALTVLFGVGLLATSGYLVSRAAEQPPVLSLTVTIVIVRFFGLARPLLRYLDRLSRTISHLLSRTDQKPVLRQDRAARPGAARALPSRRSRQPDGR